MAQVTYLYNHVAHILKTNQDIEKNIESVIYKFKINRTTLICHYLDWGLKNNDRRTCTIVSSFKI